ncbi:MAG: NACHT domain-containing protein [Candidatus Electrothrix sp. AX5]|nr:NACHT domain-containing protein [Candidatus Electrothrix sp. AX5]
MNQSLPPTQPPRKDDFVDIPNNRTLLRYYQKLYQHFSYANNFGLALDDDDRAGKKGKSILLSKLFVAPKLSASHIRPEQLVEAEHGQEKVVPERQHFADVLKEHQRLFILGDPGTGKSTLINWLMLELSYSGDSMLKLALGKVVPFAFILRDMKLSGVTSWEGLWQSWCAANPVFGSIMTEDPDTLKQVCSSGQALFLLDGLDEISNRETRAGLGRAILDGLKKYPRCRFVITSRILGFSQEELLGISSEPVGLGELPLGMFKWGGGAELFPVQYLSPFDPDQVRSFCSNWHSQYVAQDREKRFADLLERLKLNDGLARLARIPVLLNIVCFIHARRGQLPDGRAELYRRIAETYLTALDTARGIRFRDQSLQFDFYDLHGLLGAIAWRIQQGRGEENNSVVIDKAQVEEIFRQGILDTGLSEKEAEQETAFILDYIAERSGLFIPRGTSESGETLYAFTHLSFMEYFAAARLRSEVEFWDKDGAEWQDLRERMQEPVWKEVFILFFELMENARQTEHYLALLVGRKPDIVEGEGNYMPVLVEAYRPTFEQIEKAGVFQWSGFYAWAALASIIMDVAIKVPLKIRQKYIHLLWCFVLSDQVQESSFGLGLIFEYLWDEKKFGSLAEFQEQAKNKKLLRLQGKNITDLYSLTGLDQLIGLDLIFCPVEDLVLCQNLILG